jgi:hypothetical protein
MGKRVPINEGECINLVEYPFRMHLLLAVAKSEWYVKIKGKQHPVFLYHY